MNAKPIRYRDMQHGRAKVLALPRPMARLLGYQPFTKP